ncbi:hypothetical protein EC12741_B0046 [Escherichia coli 1.2741]|nr:hypothetical protein EC12741_B0046 [Escherichia coli 1.2741]
MVVPESHLHFIIHSGNKKIPLRACRGVRNDSVRIMCP